MTRKALLSHLAVAVGTALVTVGCIIAVKIWGWDVRLAAAVGLKNLSGISDLQAVVTPFAALLFGVLFALLTFLRILAHNMRIRLWPPVGAGSIAEPGLQRVLEGVKIQKGENGAGGRLARSRSPCSHSQVRRARGLWRRSFHRSAGRSARPTALSGASAATRRKLRPQ